MRVLVLVLMLFALVGSASGELYLYDYPLTEHGQAIVLGTATTYALGRGLQGLGVSRVPSYVAAGMVGGLLFSVCAPEGSDSASATVRHVYKDGAMSGAVSGAILAGDALIGEAKHGRKVFGGNKWQWVWRGGVLMCVSLAAYNGMEDR